MNEKYTYTFIIPHHNSPELLNRCLDSIPQREDIQIIVVDDNSKADKKPQITRTDVEVVYIDAAQTKGAGHARNEGFSRAQGKWLLFADCDDYYSDGFINVLDRYKNSEIDVLYYNAESKDSVTGDIVNRVAKLNRIIEDFDDSQNAIDLVKFRVHAPWNKMVRHEMVKKYGILFEEVPNGNDTMFTYQVGSVCKEFSVIHDKLYIYTINPNSITHRRHTVALYLSNICNIKKNIAFYKYIGHEEWSQDVNVKSFTWKLLKRLKMRDVALVLYVLYKYHSYITAEENKYVDLIKGIKQK